MASALATLARPVAGAYNETTNEDTQEGYCMVPLPYGFPHGDRGHYCGESGDKVFQGFAEPGDRLRALQREPEATWKEETSRR